MRLLPLCESDQVSRIRSSVSHEQGIHQRPMVFVRSISGMFKREFLPSEDGPGKFLNRMVKTENEQKQNSSILSRWVAMYSTNRVEHDEQGQKAPCDSAYPTNVSADILSFESLIDRSKVQMASLNVGWTSPLRCPIRIHKYPQPAHSSIHRAPPDEEFHN